MNATVTKKNESSELVELLTVDELAAFLKVKKSWVYGRIHARNLPFPMVKVGFYPRFPVDGVKKFILSQVVNAN